MAKCIFCGCKASLLCDSWLSLERVVVEFCSQQERSHWDLLDRFEWPNARLLDVLRNAIERKQLLRWQEPDGWRYRAAFPGVDIDRIHRVKALA